MKSRTPKSTALLCSTAPYYGQMMGASHFAGHFSSIPSGCSIGLPHQLDDMYIDATCKTIINIYTLWLCQNSY